MKECNVIGLDIAKNSFEVCMADYKGNVIERKKLVRKRVLSYFANKPASLVGLEACSGAHYWAREITKLSHSVKIIPPQYVKPFIITNKSDSKDAHGIVKSLREPSTPSIGISDTASQDLQALHRIRQRLVAERTALVNQTRGLLAEYGIVLPQGIDRAKNSISKLFLEKTDDLSSSFSSVLRDLYQELCDKTSKIVFYTSLIQTHIQEDVRGSEIQKISGIGTLTASALLIKLQNKERTYKNGRHFAASLGLIPRHEGTGGKIQIKGMSKRGDRYLRTLLIHGARTVIQHRKKNPDVLRRWIDRIVERRGIHKACVALANKHARIAWRIIAYRETYNINRSCAKE